MSNRLMTYERETQIRKTTKLQYTIHGRYVKYSMHADRLTNCRIGVKRPREDISFLKQE